MASSASSTVLPRIQKDNRGVAELAMSSSGFHDFWNHRRGRGVAAALRAHDAVDNHHSDAGQISALDAFQHRFSRRMLRFVDQHESSGAAGLDETAVKVSDSGCIPRRKADGDFPWCISE